MMEVLLMIKGKSIQLKRDKDDGIRICIMRFVRKYYDYDILMQELAPSVELLTDYKKGKINWEGYEKRYLEEIKDKDDDVQRIIELSKEKIVTLLCWEFDDKFCHRRLVINEINKKLLSS